jgi:hypothetical protein
MQANKIMTAIRKELRLFNDIDLTGFKKMFVLCQFLTSILFNLLEPKNYLKGPTLESRTTVPLTWRAPANEINFLRLTYRHYRSISLRVLNCISYE